MLRGAVLSSAAIAVAIGCSGSPKGRTHPRSTSREVKQEFDVLGSQLLARQVESKIRLLDMEYAFTTHAARFSGDLSRPHAGVLVAHAETFDDERWQELSTRDLDLGASPTIVHLVPDGPAERAGLQRGDRILSLNGVSIASGPELARFLLDAEVGATVRTRVVRGPVEHEVDVALAPACPIRIELADSTLLVPFQQEKLAILVPIGLVRFYADGDDELAVAIGHQLAHALFDRDGDDPLTRELRADRFGLALTAGAGYDISAATRYWEDVARADPRLIDPLVEDWTKSSRWPPHAFIADRMTALRSRVDEIRSQ